MCGIFGLISKDVLSREKRTDVLKIGMDKISHRGPDGDGVWLDPDGHVAFGHVRLAIIGLSDGQQPMQSDDDRFVITFNGEIYNYIELREELGSTNFHTQTDTEVILRGYQKWGTGILDKLIGMFALAIYDRKKKELFLARDQFGIKPLYWTAEKDKLVFASEQKALLPYMKELKIDQRGLSDYFSYQYTVGSKTMYAGLSQLRPGHYIKFVLGTTPIEIKYWDVDYNIDYEHTEKWFVERLREITDRSLRYHLVADTEIGSYASGGVDSSLLSILASQTSSNELKSYNGRFLGEKYDESSYAKSITQRNNIDLTVVDIQEDDFVDNIEKVIWHLDQPTAGPGSFPQYMVSQRASQDVKVVLGGQGGDELFGGYARYLVAYFEQCIKGALEGTLNDGNFLVTYDSIIPNLRTLEGYKPMLQELWSDGLFGDPKDRYWRLINRSNTLGAIIEPDLLNLDSTYEEFVEIYNGSGLTKESYFDSMTHFDFKTLLPALLSVEDRMSMAHGLEARVPILFKELMEFSATIPADIKFKDGELKRLLKIAFKDKIPKEILNRKDKMGFPVPLNDWLRKGGRTRQFVGDILGSQKAKNRFYLRSGLNIDELLNGQGSYGRNLWGLLCLELWQTAFLDDNSIA
jgi:asparagine synthase (glutamine-hydrolysing)